MSWAIPLSDVDFGPQEEQAVLRVLRRKWLTMGEETAAFERSFADMTGAEHAVAVSSGTAALHLALLALGIGPGAGVVQPALNFVAAANMTVAVGATPLFADICSLDEPTISPDSVRRLLDDILALPPPPVRPRALVVMHYGGYPCRMAELKAICEEHGLVLIEDACHGVGGTCATGAGEAHMGSVGDVGCFSFFSNKNLVTGEGGMVTTNRDDVADRVRLLRSHGMTSLTWDRHKGHAATYDVAVHGFNSRLDELRSAVGREQLAKLERHNRRRRELTALYWTELATLEQAGWILPFRERFTPARLATPTCHLMPVVAPDSETRWRRANALKAAGIQTSLHYPRVPAFKAYREHARGRWDLSAEFAERILTLPLYPTMTDNDVRTVATALQQAATRT